MPGVYKSQRWDWLTRYQCNVTGWDCKFIWNLCQNVATIVWADLSLRYTVFLRHKRASNNIHTVNITHFPSHNFCDTSLLTYLLHVSLLTVSVIPLPQTVPVASPSQHSVCNISSFQHFLWHQTFRRSFDTSPVTQLTWNVSHHTFTTVQLSSHSYGDMSPITQFLWHIRQGNSVTHLLLHSSCAHVSLQNFYNTIPFQEFPNLSPARESCVFITHSASLTQVKIPSNQTNKTINVVNHLKAM